MLPATASTSERPSHLDHLVLMIRGEFLEMPGLRLTTAQAQRLWNLDALVCESLLSALIDIGFIIRTSDGVFLRPDFNGARDSGRPSHGQGRG